MRPLSEFSHFTRPVKSPLLSSVSAWHFVKVHRASVVICRYRALYALTGEIWLRNTAAL